MCIALVKKRTQYTSIVVINISLPQFLHLQNNTRDIKQKCQDKFATAHYSHPPRDDSGSLVSYRELLN